MKNFIKQNWFKISLIIVLAFFAVFYLRNLNVAREDSTKRYCKEYDIKYRDKIGGRVSRYEECLQSFK